MNCYTAISDSYRHQVSLYWCTVTVRAGACPAGCCAGPIAALEARILLPPNSCKLHEDTTPLVCSLNRLELQALCTMLDTCASGAIPLHTSPRNESIAFSIYWVHHRNLFGSCSALVLLASAILSWSYNAGFEHDDSSTTMQTHVCATASCA